MLPARIVLKIKCLSRELQLIGFQLLYLKPPAAFGQKPTDVIRLKENMSSNQQVNEALEQFSEWARPWTYVRETLAAKGLTVQNAALVEEVWQEANSSTHWIQPSFESGAELANAALRTRYSWLSEAAISNLVRGASYMWK